MSDLETKIGQSFAAQGLMKAIGAQIAHVSEGEVHIALPFSTLLSQQHAYVHAGAIASILDTACGPRTE
jgi:acyl-coenzyme A thioesterase PaaI-like protein